ncbi:toll-like receptor 5 [Puntigrus tetrazona]|uniref:toll-like receptor 5 n=1 Tax=Puntigrus tetrazona TaxID=1606681 RepID=UPI001C8974EF|nr:toll-like receptor 5 [Puntigrus tetrazona]
MTDSALRMATKQTLSLVLLGLYMSTQIVKCTSVCSINGSVVLCTNRSLQEVPELPAHVNNVDLSNNSIAELHEASFTHLEGLQVIILMRQTPGLVIRNNTFRRLSNLTSLKLDYNHLLQIDSGAFNGLSNLKNLTLTQCSLDGSVLSSNVLEPLVSLEMLVLRENNIQRIQPASFFSNMRRFHVLDLSHNKVKSICEEELLSFQGKHFTLLKLASVTLQDMNEYWLGWDKCGNPFKNMSVTVLDLSENSFNVNNAKLFFNAITGAKIQSVIFSNICSLGKSSGNNSKDPDKFTFKGLEGSGIKSLDLSKSSIFSLSYSVFCYLGDLEHISLAQSQINKIESSAFLGMTNLRKLNLSVNFLGNIDSETFKNLEKLEVLDLSYNHIWMFGLQSFQGLPNLLILNLTGNSILHAHRFATLPKLEQLYLGDNKIVYASNLLNIATNLKTLYLEFNKIISMSELYTILETFPQIEEIVFRGNELVYCPDNNYEVLSQKIKILDLALAGLEIIWSEGKCLNVFNNLHQLEVLYLSSNRLQSLPEDVFKDLTSLVFLDLSSNSLKYLPNGIFPRRLQYLNLEYNSIYSVDPNLFSTLSYLSLLGNDFQCDCKLRDFQTWLNQTNIILSHPIEDMTCASPEDQYMVPVVSSRIQCEDEEDEKRAETLRLVLFIFCSALIALFTTSIVIYVRRRGYIFKLYKKLVDKLVDGKQQEPDPDRFLYDVYLCFSSSDIKWVERALLKKLDSQFSEQNTLHCCFEERDFIPGEDHLTNMRNAIQNSQKTLCVVSERFLKDGWCLETFTLAQCRMLVELKDILLVLVVGNIPQYRLLKYEQLRSYIENRRYLLWPDDSQDLEWFYDQLLHNIRKNTKVKETAVKVKDKEVENNPEAAHVHVDTAV